MLVPAVVDQTCVPVAASTAYSLPKLDPTYTYSLTTSIEDCRCPSPANVQQSELVLTSRPSSVPYEPKLLGPFRKNPMLPEKAGAFFEEKVSSDPPVWLS